MDSHQRLARLIEKLIKTMSMYVSVQSLTKNKMQHIKQWYIYYSFVSTIGYGKKKVNYFNDINYSAEEAYIKAVIMTGWSCLIFL